MKCARCGNSIYYDREAYDVYAVCYSGHRMLITKQEPLPLYMEKAKTAEKHRALMVHSGKRSKRLAQWR